MFELNGVELTSQDIKNYAQENDMSFTEGYEFLLGKGLKEKSVESSVGLMENLFPQIDPVEEIEDVSSVKDAGVWAMTGIVDAMDDLGNIFTGSVQRAKLLDPISRIKKGTATDEDIQQVLEFNKNPDIGMTDEILKQDFERELIAEKYGKPAAFFMTFFKEGTAQKFLQSTFLQVGALATERGRAQAAKGAGIGVGTAASLNLVPGLAFLPEEIASIPIMALSGGYAGISQALEVQLTLSELITEELLEKGINANDATVEDVRAIMEDEEVFSDIRKRAVRRGNTIGTIDGFTGIFLKGAIRKGRGVTKRSIPTRSRTSGYLAGSAFETGMGLTSELAGQIAGEQDLDITAILEEGFIDKTMAPVSLASNLYKGPATYSINGKEGDSGKMSAKKFFKYVNSLSDTELYEQMPLFKVENDKLASNILNQRVYDVAVDMEVDTRINDPKKRAEAIKLQKELNKIKDKKGATYDKRRSKLKEKINAIADEFADNEVDVTKEQQNEAIKLERKDNVKKLIKSESEKLKEMGKDLGGLDLDAYDTEQEMVDAFVAAGGNINEISRDADGKVTQEALILGEKMFINIDRAAAIESINPASHEVLHRVIGNSFASLDEATRLKVAGGFFNTMTKSQRKFVTQRLKDDYNVDAVDDSFFKTNQAEEIFTVFAQGIRDNDITFDEGLFSKLGLILQEFLRKSPIFKGKFKGEFTNGKQVYNFLKQYNQDIETGKFSERVKDFAAVDRADETKTAASNRQISDEAKNIQAEVDALGKKADGSKMTKSEYDAGPNIKAYEELISKGKLRTLIKNQLVKQGIDIQAEDANVNGIPLQEFLEDVEGRLTTEILNFNPDKETTTQGKFGLSGFINQRIIFRTGDVAKTGKKRVDTKSLDKEQESAGGKSMADNIQDKEDASLEDLETEDLSAQAQQDKKIKEDKGEAGIFSKLRKRLTLKGQPILGERTNSESIVNTILVEVRRIFVSERTPLSSDSFLANLEKSLDARLFKLIKNALGTKKAYDDFIIENASEIANLPTKHLVALEREVKDDADRMFTEFDKKLTSKEDVQRAVDQGLLDKDALTKIDKGQAVNLYRKKNNINLDNVVKFFDAPPINPKTSKRSGLKGTRKDTLARRFAFELAQDALPEIASMPEVADYRSLIDNAEFGKVQINELSRMINREPRLMFSETKASGKRAPLTNTQKALQKGSNISVPVQNYLEKLLNGELKQSEIDENDINQLLANKFFLERPYERISDKGILKDLLSEITKLRKKGFKTQKIYKMYEQHFIALANAVMQENSAISADKVVREGGRPDLTFIYDNSGTIVGVEIKMDTARGVAQTASFKLVNDKFEVSFSNPNPQDTQAEQDLQNKMSERLAQLLEGISFDNENQGVSTDDANKLKLISHTFLKDMRVEITAAYIAAHYNMKNLPETFINIGNAGLFYMLENVVKPEQSKFYKDKVKKLVSEGISEADAQKQARKEFVETREITMRVAEALNIPELKSNQKLYLGARLIISDARKTKGNTHRVTGKIEPQIDSKNFDKSTFGNLSNPKDMARFVEALNNDSVKYGSKSSNRNLQKAAMNARLVDKNTKAKGISIWDFDDTLAQTKSNVLFTDPNGKKGKLNAEDFAKKGADLLSKGYVFDFSEFSKVTDGTPGPFFKKAIDRIKKFGNKDNFILTARPADAAGPIKQFLDSLGLDIPLENITGLTNSTPQAKALWIVDKVADGYNDIYFADDALANVQVVKDVLEQFDIKSDVQQAKIKASNRRSVDFNKILERKTGVPFNETFSRARAIKRGKDKNKFQLFVPPSAEDFVGLIYYMIGKGRQGEQDFQFLKKNLIDPFARASREVDMARQSIVNDWNNVRKKHKAAVKKLSKKIPGMDYTYDDAIRVFLWEITGQEIPGLDKKEIRELRDVVVKNMGLIKFAMDLKLIVQLKDGYVKPGESWTAGSIASDVNEAVNDIRRSEFLQEWSQNIKELFTEENLNKLEALFGTTYRQSLEDILYRMEKGKNRPKGTDAATNRFMNWLAGSVGAIMFFNVKSAVLQNISILNYINYTDNNPIQAAKAFANQKQYWADFAFIFNSDFLKQRRSGLNTHIESNELASIAANATNKARAILAYLLKIGFTPTQIADSFAISVGGATFYRNRVKRFVSEGMSQAEAETQAFAEFRETTEESQQSARPDRISKQQASSLGRLLLNFQNYPMQQNRIIKKTVLDMKNGRGDMKQHVSRLLYYGFAQNIIFLSLQNALFAMLFEEAEDDDELLDTKTERIFNGVADTLLRGSGIVGGVIATVKNTLLMADTQLKKGRKGEGAKVLIEVANLSPSVGSKLRKIYKGYKSADWDRNAISEMPLYDSRNPIWSISAPVIEATTNAPVDRIVRKINNIRLALDSNYSAMARLSMFLGVSPYELGINPSKDVKDAKQRAKDKNKGKGNQSTSTKKGEKRCKAATSSGPRCKNMTNNKNGRCYAHQ